MKLCHTIGCVILCGLCAFVLDIVSISMDVWWHAPSANSSQDGDKVLQPFQLRGLWNYDSETITKYKLNGRMVVVEESMKINDSYIRGDVPGWFEAVKVFEIIGCITTIISFGISILWEVRYFTSESICNKGFSRTTLILYLVSAIMILFGIIIMVGKTDSKQIAWGPSVAGFSGAFCVMAASIIRWNQQPEFNF